MASERFGVRFGRTLLCSASILGLSSAAWGQNSSSVETVVVTGSRVIADAANSPTPLTIVTTEQLQVTTPTNIPDGLNKLPVFAGSATQRSNGGGATTNSPGNVLTLRNFGAQRTLILLDGHRVPASVANGTTDIDTLPQMLVSRVDVVTGGASAVYGSDAVTGVVNFVLDKHFNGVKYNASGGISSHGVGATYQAGFAAGSDIFGGRGHIEGAFRLFNSDPVLQLDLPYGPAVWGSTGSGSATSPITATKNVRVNWAFNGLVAACGTGCTAANMQFAAPGVLGGYNAGAPTLSASIASGGDGGYATNTDAQAGLKSYESFARASYNIDDTTSVYVQASVAQSKNRSNFYNAYLVNGAAPAIFFKNNAFLPAATQAQLNTGTGSTFQLVRMIPEVPGYVTVGINRAINVTAGVDGTLMGSYNWDIYYTHGENRLTEDYPGNQDAGKLLAAEDAVTNAAGQVVCYATTPAAGAAVNAAYAGCVPINPFGPKTVGSTAFEWYTATTNFHQINMIDDLGGSISGDIFDLPAGPLKAAISGEARWMSLEIQSNFSPTAVIDCTGLRLCPATPQVKWISNVVAAMPTATNSVWEFAGELNAPILKGVPLVQSFDVNLAGRFTDYSTSGAVQTWKIGLDWHISDDLRLRATNSVDIRAPNLTDLFGPVQSGPSGYTDVHTKTSGVTILQGAGGANPGGNPNLVPEVARTYTAGAVLTPSFIPNLTVSVDWYQIVLKNALATIAGANNTIQNLCEASAPSGYNSPFCQLYIRPLPFSDTSPANFPTKVLSTSLNAALNKISGIDIEANYAFNLADLVDGLDGSVSLRELMSLQPVNETQNFTGAAFTFVAQPKARSTTFLSYSVGNWGVNLQDTWTSGWKKASTLVPLNYVVPRVISYNILDLEIDRKFDIGGSSATTYLSVNNIFDAPGPLYPTNTANPAFAYPVPGGYPVLGRVFTLGIRGKF